MYVYKIILYVFILRYSYVNKGRIYLYNAKIYLYKAGLQKDNRYFISCVKLLGIF